MTKSVYIDTSVVSYLTARPTRDMRTATRQVETIEWWTMESRHFDLFSSEVAIEEGSRGNPDAAQRRVEVLREMTILTVTPDASDLADALNRRTSSAARSRRRCQAHRYRSRE